jgi:hypothetical protein
VYSSLAKWSDQDVAARPTDPAEGVFVRCSLAGQSTKSLETFMSLRIIFLIILAIALLGGVSGIGGGPFYGTGY